MKVAKKTNVSKDGSPEQLRTGTQSLSKGVHLLRMVAMRPQFGWRLSDLAVACNQGRATVHRMLACLVEERLVEQRQSDRHYLPGPLMYELGLARTEDIGFHARAEVIVKQFAKRMAGIARLQLRSGDEYVCSIREGHLKLTGDMVEVGVRRPLCTSAAGLAIVQTLPIEQAEGIYRRNLVQETLRLGPKRLRALQTLWECSYRHGFGVNFGFLVPGSYAFAVPVKNSAGDAMAAICLVGTPDLYGEDQLTDLRHELEATASLLTAEARRLIL
ncbi:MAG: transcriptional regulator [Comamonadaceae bacterium]|nr:MAG: transcriptional regulator [Comamonadaceae bacterium]